MAPEMTLQFFLFRISTLLFVKFDSVKDINVYTSFYDVCVLLSANTLKQYWQFFCQVLLNLLFIIRSSCLCIGVVCLFIYYVLRHINMCASFIMNGLETLSDVSFVLFQLCIWYVLWWFPTPGGWLSLL